MLMLALQNVVTPEFPEQEPSTLAHDESLLNPRYRDLSYGNTVEGIPLDDHSQVWSLQFGSGSVVGYFGSLETLLKWCDSRALIVKIGDAEFDYFRNHDMRYVTRQMRDGEHNLAPSEPHKRKNLDYLIVPDSGPVLEVKKPVEKKKPRPPRGKEARKKAHDAIFNWLRENPGAPTQDVGDQFHEEFGSFNCTTRSVDYKSDLRRAWAYSLLNEMRKQDRATLVKEGGKLRGRASWFAKEKP